MNNWTTLDCVTYIEAVLAQYLGGEHETGDALKQLRYNRLPATFIHRNHSIRHDWIPNAISRGFISDITAAQFGRDKVVRRIWSRDPASWFQRIGPGRTYCRSDQDRLLGELRRQAEKLQQNRSIYKVMPLHSLLPPRKLQAEPLPESGWDRLNKLSSGTLLAFFGKGEHLAWLINEAGELRIRHACRARRSVRDDSLATFLRMQVALGYLSTLALLEVT